jgi:predicted  nucleic acid-binding Zn-ribbon protein
MTKDEKIKRIVEIRKSIAELKQLKKEVKGRDNSKRLKHSKMNEWAKDCLDNSAWVESRLRTLDHYINEAQTKIEELKLQLEFS